ISEARSTEGGVYGEERIGQKLKEWHQSSPKKICESFLEDVNAFSSDSDYSDDQTIVVVKRIH
ncbi:MAG: SpoIIE family protein phosphatase, partial [Bacteroidota bacterium]